MGKLVTCEDIRKAIGYTYTLKRCYDYDDTYGDDYEYSYPTEKSTLKYPESLVSYELLARVFFRKYRSSINQLGAVIAIDRDHAFNQIFVAAFRIPRSKVWGVYAFDHEGVMFDSETGLTNQSDALRIYGEFHIMYILGEQV